MNGSAVRTWRAAQSRTWRLRQWPNDPTAMLLVFVDHLAVPSPDDLRDAISEARRHGTVFLRTSALFPRAATVVVDNGFEVIDTLALLRLPLDQALSRHLVSRSGDQSRHGPRPTTRPMRAWHHRQAAALDRAAFGELWGNDAGSLADIRDATPVHRARMVRVDGELAGFAISGAGGESGYIQRIAVADAHRRQGFGRDLVVDALRWMCERLLLTAYVNTGVANAPALALYEDLGFTRMDDELTIAEHRVDA